MDYERRYLELKKILEDKYEELKNVDTSSYTPSSFMRAGKIDVLQEILIKMYENSQKYFK